MAVIAEIPNLKACSAFGETPAEALAELEIAKTAWLEAARQEGRYSMEEARLVSEQWRQHLAGRMTSDGADLIREDRER